MKKKVWNIDFSNSIEIMPLWGISVFPQKYIFTNGWVIYGTYWAYYGLLGTYTVPVEPVRGAWVG